MLETNLITTQDAADALGLHRDSLRRWRRRGIGPPFVRISRTKIMYPAQAIEDWIDLHTENF